MLPIYDFYWHQIVEYLKNIEITCDLNHLINIKKQRSQWIETHVGKTFLKWFESLPKIKTPHLDVSTDTITIGRRDELKNHEFDLILSRAKKLIPWKKGPFCLFGELIDGEWNSSLKWKRVKNHLIDVTDKVVLDLGCNNGYYLFKLLHLNPKLILGFDPMIHCYLQFIFLNHFVTLSNTYYELFGIEELGSFENSFDLILCMGVIYHRRHPLKLFTDIKKALKPGGQAIIETIGINGNESTALFPSDKYAGMSNVWFVPTLPCLLSWAQRTKWNDIQMISDSWEYQNEQRITPWCPPPRKSIIDYLKNPNETIEGYPAPKRFALSLIK